MRVHRIMCLIYWILGILTLLCEPCKSQNQTKFRPSGSGAANGSKDDSSGTKYTPRSYVKSTPLRMSFDEECDYLAYYCIRAYKTGKLCARTVYYHYETFDNYCMLDYLNCMERYEVWQVAHMGECFNITMLTDYAAYEYLDDHFLDVYYVIQD